MDGISSDDPHPLTGAIRTGTPEFIRNYGKRPGNWPPTRTIPAFGPFTAVSIVPLSPIGDQPLGAWVVTYAREHDAPPDERALMATLADLAGQAIKRIRSRQSRVELATALQQHMLPTLPEQLPGMEVAARYQPSRDGLDIGGDWYDAFVMPDGAVALEIGDSQGHDVDAAATMGQVRTSIRAIAPNASHPAAVLTRTNELLVTMDVARFSSCMMLYVGPDAGQVTAPARVTCRCCGSTRTAGARSTSCRADRCWGVLPGTDYLEETFTLEQGEALVLVTDGAVEGPSLTFDARHQHAGRALPVGKGAARRRHRGSGSRSGLRLGHTSKN